MFQPELSRRDDPAVVAARNSAAAGLFRAVRRALGPAREDEVWGGVVAAWSFTHGFATLWLGGNFAAGLGDDPAEGLPLPPHARPRPRCPGRGHPEPAAAAPPRRLPV